MSNDAVLKVPKGERVSITSEAISLILENGRIELFGTLNVPGHGEITEEHELEKFIDTEESETSLGENLAYVLNDHEDRIQELEKEVGLSE